MKIIYIYIAKKFIPPFLFAFGVFCLIVFLGDVFENLQNLSNGTATFHSVLKYALFRLPYWSSLLIPLACMLASVFTITELVSSGEWTAAVAGGYRPLQLFMPVLVCVFIISALSFLNQEYFNPWLEQKSEEVYKIKIQGYTDYKAEVQKNVTLKLPGNAMLFAAEVESKAGLMRNVTMDVYDKTWAIEKQFVADKMQYDGGKWYFVNGLERDFENDINLTEEHFDKALAAFSVPPKQIIVGDVSETSISIKDLLRKIKFLRKSGLADYKERTYLHNKLAMPLSTLLMCMLVMPFAVVTRKRNKAVSIIFALALAFAYWTVSSLAVTAGENGMLNPVAASWGIAAVCAVIVFIQYRLMKI